MRITFKSSKDKIVVNWCILRATAKKIMIDVDINEIVVEHFDSFLQLYHEGLKKQ